MENNYDLTAFDKVLADVKDIQDQANFLPDMTTKEGYEASKRLVLDVTTPARKALEKAHKDTKAPFLETCRFLDGKKKELMPLLESIEAPHKEAYKAIDQEKKDKKARFDAEIESKVQELYNFRNLAIGKTSDEITDLIDSCGEVDTEEGFYSRANDAFIARRESLELLNDALMAAIQAEAEAVKQAEIAEQQRIQQEEFNKQQELMRQQQEEMDRKQALIDAKEAEQLAQQQAIEDEKQAKAAELARIEREKQQAIEREEYAKEQSKIAAENARLAEVKRQKDEQDLINAQQAKLEANNAHVSKICKQAKEFIMSFDVDEKTAVKIVKAIGNKTESTLTLNLGK